VNLDQDHTILESACWLAATQPHNGPIPIAQWHLTTVHRRARDANGKEFGRCVLKWQPSSLGIERCGGFPYVTCCYAQVRVGHDAAAGADIDDRGLHRLDPKTIGTGVEAYVKVGARLARPRSKPPTEQVRKLIAF